MAVARCDGCGWRLRGSVEVIPTKCPMHVHAQAFSSQNNNHSSVIPRILLLRTGKRRHIFTPITNPRRGDLSDEREPYVATKQRTSSIHHGAYRDPIPQAQLISTAVRASIITRQPRHTFQPHFRARIHAVVLTAIGPAVLSARKFACVVPQPFVTVA